MLRIEVVGRSLDSLRWGVEDRHGGQVLPPVFPTGPQGGYAFEEEMPGAGDGKLTALGTSPWSPQCRIWACFGPDDQWLWTRASQYLRPSLCSQVSSLQCWCRLSPVIAPGEFHSVSEVLGCCETLLWSFCTELYLTNSSTVSRKRFRTPELQSGGFRLQRREQNGLLLGKEGQSPRLRSPYGPIYPSGVCPPSPPHQTEMACGGRTGCSSSSLPLDLTPKWSIKPAHGGYRAS